MTGGKFLLCACAFNVSRPTDSCVRADVRAVCPLTGTKSVSGPAFGYLLGCENTKYLAHPFAIPFGMLGTLVFGTGLVPGAAVGLVQCLGGFICSRRCESIDSPVARFRPVSFWTGSCVVAAEPSPPPLLIPIVLGLYLDPADALPLSLPLPESCC